VLLYSNFCAELGRKGGRFCMICRVLDLGVAWWSWKGGWVRTTGATGLFLKRRIGTTCEVGGYTLIRVNSSGKGFTIFFLLSDTWRRYDMIAIYRRCWCYGMIWWWNSCPQRFTAKWGVLGTRSSYRRGTELVGAVGLAWWYSECCKKWNDRTPR